MAIPRPVIPYADIIIAAAGASGLMPFRLLQEGCREIMPELRLEAADEDLTCTALMRQLPSHGVTVAQFGQAVGAMYYAAI